MQHRKLLLSSIFLFFLGFNLLAQTSIPNQLAARLAKFWLYSPQEKIHLHTDKPYYSTGENIWFKAYLVNATTHRPDTKSQFIYTELCDQNNKLIQRIKIKRDSLGFAGHFYLDPKMKAGSYYLRAYTHWMRNCSSDFYAHKKLTIGNAFYEQETLLPQANPSDFDVQFFPESGNFILEEMQTLGYKAVGSDGLSVAIKGTITNADGEEILDFSSFHKGMGKIAFLPHQETNYTAHVEDQFGNKKSIPLPIAKANGIALKILYNRGFVQYQVINKTNIPNDSLFLAMHCRGFVNFISPLSQTEGRIAENQLPEGIITCSVIDKSGQTYAERLFFCRNFKFASVSMNQNKPSWIERDKVKLNFQLSDIPGDFTKGEYSVSVTDLAQVKQDSLGSNLINNLLLTSDIKGWVEDPQAYFKDDSRQTREITDLLMLTQGWRRFNTEELLQGKYPNNNFYLEAGQSLSGKILNLFNKPVKDIEVIMFGYKNQIATAKTDSNGVYVIDGIWFPDSAKMAIKAKSRSKIVDVGIIPETESFPTLENYIPSLYKQKLDYPDEYLFQQKSKFFADGGMLMVELDEFNVNAEKKSTRTNYYYSGQADQSFNAEKLADYAGLRILDIIQMFPGVLVNGEEISIRGGGMPLFVVNGVETDRLEDIMYINNEDIEEISIFKGPSAVIFGSRGGNGVITIDLKEGYINTKEDPSSLAIVQPLGFQKPASFYVPAYEIDSVLHQTKPDYRTTIYWNPGLKADSLGNIQVEFFTADKNDDYHLELEGIGEKGNLCRFNAVLKRKP